VNEERKVIVISQSPCQNQWNGLGAISNYLLSMHVVFYVVRLVLVRLKSVHMPER